MLRTIRVAILVGVLTIASAGCGDDNDTSAAEPAASHTQEADEPAGPAGSSEMEVAFEAPGAPVPALLTGNCNPADAADCVLPTNFAPTQVTGDLRGTAFGTAAVISRNGVYPGTSLVVFTGEVEGCGTGGLVVTTVGTFDPSTGETNGEWTINAEGGTGELADVSGSGTSITDSTSGRYKGRLRCR